MPKKRQPFFRRGEKKQTTEQGFDIPIPKRKDVLAGFDKASRTKKRPAVEREESEKEQR
jgi:hypothetical protein